MVPGFVPVPPAAAPTFIQCFQVAWDQTASDMYRSAPLPTTLAVLAWPWLTLLALLVFAQSMRRAKINPLHVLRVIVYGCDFGIIVLPLLGYLWVLRRPDGWPVVVTLVCAAVTLYRVSTAYSRYLRFHLPFVTVLTSQIMVFMVALIVYFQFFNPWW